MNMNEVMPEDLSYLYPDFIDYIHQCRFNGCMHDKEPGCMIKEAVAEGSISQGRYDRYIRNIKRIKRNLGGIYGNKNSTVDTFS